MSSTNKLTKKQREKEFHKQQIIESAIKIFAQYGYAEATVEKIAMDSQFGKGSLYNYFPSKKMLFIESFKYIFKELLFVAQSSLSEGKNLRDKLANYVTVTIKYFNENKDSFSFLENVFYNMHLDKRLKKVYDYHLSEINNQLSALFEYNKKRDSNLNPTCMAFLFNNYIYSFLLHRVSQKEVYTINDYQSIADELVSLFLNGYKNYSGLVK